MRRFEIGDSVYYYLPRSKREGRATMWCLRSIIVSIGPKRIRIRPNGMSERNVSPSSIGFEAPDGTRVLG